MHTLKLNNGRVISYNREGNLVGETIIFVHSFLCDKEMWAPQIEALKAEYDCISIDLYGHGNSGLLNEDVSLKDIAQDILDFVDELGLLFFHYIGISIGGMLVPYINKMCSQVESFTIFNGYLDEEFEIQKKLYFNSIQDIKKQGEITKEVAKVISTLFFSSKNPNLELVNNFEEKLINIKKENIPTICNVGNAIFSRESSLDLLKKITTKTSFIVGENDICRTKEKSDAMAKIVKNSHVYTIENAGHSCTLENPIAVNKILTRLFDMDESSSEKIHFFFND